MLFVVELSRFAESTAHQTGMDGSLSIGTRHIHGGENVRYGLLSLYLQGVIRGRFKVPHRLSLPQRLSSTAVYPPCPRATRANPDACRLGHDGYTATG